MNMIKKKVEDLHILDMWKRFVNHKFLDWQKNYEERKTVTEFASSIGFTQPTVSLWMNGTRIPKSQEDIQKLALLWGLEVYDALNLPRPDAYLYTLQSLWNDLPAEKRRAISEDAVQYLKTHRKAK